MEIGLVFIRMAVFCLNSKKSLYAKNVREHLYSKMFIEVYLALEKIDLIRKTRAQYSSSSLLPPAFPDFLLSHPSSFDLGA